MKKGLISKLLTALLVVGLLFSILPSQQAQAADIVHTVTPGSSDWSFVNDNGKPGVEYGFVSGPDSPLLGTGSANIKLTASDAGAILMTQKYQGVKLADITTLSYSTYTNASPAAIAFQINYDFDLTATGDKPWYGRLNYEPYWSGTAPTNGTWETWNLLASEARWWASSNGNSPVDDLCHADSPCTIEQILANWPNIGIRNDASSAILFKAGSGYLIDGYVDNMRFGVSGGNVDVYDFEYLTPIVYVDAAGNCGGNAPCFATIQAGIDAVAADGTVNVYSGEYDETAPNSLINGQGAPYTFGLFFEHSKPGITLQGVKADGTVITNPADIAAKITTNANNSFGSSGVFVSADDITITGLEFGDNYKNTVLDNNKTIEVIGDGFTFKNNVISSIDGGALYFGEWAYDGTAATARIKEYTIENNLFKNNATVSISSGTGVEGEASKRIINNNTFSADGIAPQGAAISFNGIVETIGWYNYPVGGATITGNQFTDSELPIRSRGTVDDDFVWEAYLANNTFDKAVVAWDPVAKMPRAWSYTSGAYVYDTVRSIGTSIQEEIGHAADGDTVLVLPGTYNEPITLNKPKITVKSTEGAATTFINTPTGSSKAVGFADNLGTVTFEGFTVQGFTSAGIVQGSASVGTTVNIIDNIVKPTGFYTTNLIQVVGDGSVVSGNKITASGNPYPHHEGAGNTAIMVMNGSNITITDNVINGGLADRLGLDQAIVLWNYNAPSGIPMSNIQITGNTVTNVNWLLNFMEKDDDHKIGLVSIEKNKFTDANFIVWDDLPRDISRNWWGSPAGPDPELINGDGDITYKPWCANEECTEFLPAEVTISPVAPIVCGVTTTSTIEINVKGVPTATPIQGYQFRLHFDPAKTSIANFGTDILNGGFIADGGMYMINYVDESTGTFVADPTGTVDIAYSKFGPSTSVGDGKLVSVKLTHLGVAGDMEFSLSDVLVIENYDMMPIPVEVSTVPTVLTLNPLVTNTTRNLGYCDLKTAVNQAGPNDILKVEESFTTTDAITITKSITLNTNGKTITRTGDSGGSSFLNVIGGGNLTIDGGGTITTTSGNAVLITGDGVSSAKVKLVDATLYGPNLAVGVVGNTNPATHGTPYSAIFEMVGGATNETVLARGNGAELIISGGTMTGATPVMGNGTVTATRNDGGTKITISGEVVIGSDTLGWAAIYHPQDGELIINGGTIVGYTGIEMKAGNLLVNGGTIMGKGAFVSPLPNDNGTANSGDAILLNGRDAYTGDITLNITGGTISAAYGYAVRDHSADDQALKTSDVEITGGSFYGGVSVTEPVTFSTKFVALHEASTDPLLRLLPGGLYNTDPAKSVYVPYGTKMNSEGTMWEVYQLTLSVRDFFYNTEHVVDPPRDQWLRGVSANFDANFLFSEAKSVLVELFTGTDDLLQSNLLIAPSAHPGNSLSTSFDFFGDYTTTKWTNVRDVEYGQTAAPTFVRISVEFPNGTLTAISLAPTGDRSTILPGVSGLITLQGILNPKAGVPVTLTSGGVVLNASSTALPLINYSFTGVETLTYTITTSQPRYLNLTSASAKFILVDGDKVLNPLRLFGGDVNQDNEIGVGDSGLVGTSWGSTANPEANINYDGIVNIQDLAMVGGNYGLTSATAYTSWVPLQ